MTYLFSKTTKDKVEDLEQKCQIQSDKCNILSKELEKFHLGLQTDREHRPEITTSRRAICDLLNELQSRSRKGRRSLLKISYFYDEFVLL